MTKQVKPKKIAAVVSLKDKLKRSKSVILADYTGLTVEEITGLRKELRKSKTEFTVVKNTLLNLALEGGQTTKLKELLKGPVAVAFGYEDEVAPARIIQKFIKDFEKLTVKGGLVDNCFVDASQVKELSKLPSREQLIAMVVGGIMSPISGFHNVCQGLLRSLVYALSEVQKKKS